MTDETKDPETDETTTAAETPAADETGDAEDSAEA